MTKATDKPPVDNPSDTEEQFTVYLATDTINHDGKSYSAGAVVDDLTDDQALPLLAAGVVVVHLPEEGVVVL